MVVVCPGRPSIEIPGKLDCVVVVCPGASTVTEGGLSGLQGSWSVDAVGAAPPPGAPGAPPGAPGADGGAGVSEQNLHVFAQLAFIASFMEQHIDKYWLQLGILSSQPPPPGCDGSFKVPMSLWYSVFLYSIPKVGEKLMLIGTKTLINVCTFAATAVFV